MPPAQRADPAIGDLLRPRLAADLAHLPALLGDLVQEGFERLVVPVDPELDGRGQSGRNLLATPPMCLQSTSSATSTRFEPLVALCR